MNVKLPNSFDIEYPDENRAYYTSETSKRIILDLLKNASNGYCMYCGTSLDVERMDLSQIEHSVDKDGNNGQRKGKLNKLANCKFNLALACKDCNMKYKKQVIKADLKGRLNSECGKKCTELCADYALLREKYIEDNRIILQPRGINKDAKQYEVIYKPLEDLYCSNSNDDEINIFINQHIMRFHLNGEKRSRNIIDICSDIVELNEMGVDNINNILNFVSNKRQINIIGTSFAKYLVDKFSDRSVEELVDYCRTVVISSVWF